MRLERKQMLQVEGGTDVECMRILRHEAGHAIDNAFRLHFKRRWHRIFGLFTQRYPDFKGGHIAQTIALKSSLIKLISDALRMTSEDNEINHVMVSPSS